MPITKTPSTVTPPPPAHAASGSRNPAFIIPGQQLIRFRTANGPGASRVRIGRHGGSGGSDGLRRRGGGREEHPDSPQSCRSSESRAAQILYRRGCTTLWRERGTRSRRPDPERTLQTVQQRNPVSRDQRRKHRSRTGSGWWTRPPARSYFDEFCFGTRRNQFMVLFLNSGAGSEQSVVLQRTHPRTRVRNTPLHGNGETVRTRPRVLSCVRSRFETSARWRQHAGGATGVSANEKMAAPTLSPPLCGPGICGTGETLDTRTS